MTESAVQSSYGLDQQGITDTGPQHWNLTIDALLEIAAERNEGQLTHTRALSCTTGAFTGRSPGDKYIVKDSMTEQNVDWGDVNQPISEKHFDMIHQEQLQYLKGKELFVRDAFGGKDPANAVPIRVINEAAWANLFCHHMFVRPSNEQLADHKPQFTIIHTPGFKANPEIHGTNTDVFVMVNMSKGLVLIGGTHYAGEMKKSIFSILNYLYPLAGILPMHCSANVGAEGDSALFFGLSGTGKTTLSADPNRRLIGDDEHGWSDTGVFNFEGGCYAKCISLSEENEPQIWHALRDGAILENVVVDPATGIPDYDDGSLTENTRGAYPIDYIEGAVPEGVGGHPKNIVFLTCDAFGVMPPISRLTPAQAMYHFLSGYTAKVAGTERGMSNSPQATFSACFGSPFLPLRPTAYAEMLGKKMEEHGSNCWLVNTGWVGGGYGVGNRIKLPFTRAMIEAALSGELDNVEYETDPVFGLSIPRSVPNVPDELLNPRAIWEDAAAYDAAATNLAERFRKNFAQFEGQSAEIESAGPIA